MTTLEITLTEDALTIVVSDSPAAIEPGQVVLPVGLARLRDELDADPPRPEALTNAIGAVYDHVDDIVRDDPSVVGAEVRVRGAAVEAIAAVEVGGTPGFPFELTRAAAEDVFRTVATEPTADRRHNPGLRAPLVEDVVAGCCAVVGIMRRLHLDRVVVVG